MSGEDDRNERERPKLRQRVGQGLSFMNKIAVVILVLGCLAVLFKHR
ncbi:MAG: hypothetical protein H7247_11600 [Polaromonas sp.]|nr:hypothetical protein [Gemmatimonadaceae bacterium]